jgi:hypothetical protein
VLFRSKIKSPLPVEKIRIYNAMGELVQKFQPGANEYIINLSDERKGVYFISVDVNERIAISKIVLL